MASIEKRTTPKGSPFYLVRYRDIAGRQRTKSHRRKVDAENFAATTRADLVRGDWIDPDKTKETVIWWAPHWLTTKNELKNTDRHRGILEHHVLPRWGDTSLSAITYRDVTTWLDELRDAGLSASSRRKIRDALSGIFQIAERSGSIKGNPVAGIKIKGDPKTEKRFLIGDQVDLLADIITYPSMIGLHSSRQFDGLRPDLGALVRFTAGTGLRRGEVLGLTVADIDLERRRVSVPKRKTDASERQVPITAALMPVLVDQIDRVGAKGWLFPNADGGQLDGAGFYRRHYVPATVRAGLAPLRFHDLRHTFAALMIHAGAKPFHLKTWMGHSSITVTYDVYGHLFDDDDPEVMAAFDEAFLG